MSCVDWDSGYEIRDGDSGFNLGIRDQGLRISDVMCPIYTIRCIPIDTPPEEARE